MRRLPIAAVFLVLAACASVTPGDPSAWRGGGSRVKITPPKSGWMTGYGNRNKPADGVKQDLWVRALALEDGTGTRALLVSADILGFPTDLSRAIKQRIRSELRVSEERVVLVATHTHAGPAIPQRPSMEIFHGLDQTTGASIFEYAAWLSDRILEACREALEGLGDVAVESARGTESFGMNRRFRNENGAYSIKDNPGGAHDPEVFVLRVRKPSGNPIAFAYTYACHCTTLGGNIYQYHGDWAGVASEEIEKSHPAATALFATGCGADLNPSPRGTFELAEKHGQSMARTVLGLKAWTPVPGPLKAVIDTIDLPLEAAPSRELLEKQAASKDVYRQRHGKEMLKLLEAGKLPKAVPLPIQVWQFGPGLTMVALGGETCVEYALRIKEKLGAGKGWVVGYANEIPCYIPSEKVLAEGGYEPGWDLGGGKAIASGSMMYYGWPTPFAAGIETRILSTLDRLLK